LRKQIELRALEKLIHNEILLQAAKDENYKISPKETSKHIERLKSRFSNEKDFNSALKKYNLTYQQFEKKVEEEMLISTYLEQNIGNLEVSEAELKAALNVLGKVNDKSIEDKIKKELLIKKKQKKIKLFIGELKEGKEIEIHI
jgi:hypothetical protein